MDNPVVNSLRKIQQTKVKGYIYKIVNSVNGKYYLGSTTNLSKREKSHFWKLKKGKHHSIKLQNAFNKYGEAAFSFVVLYESDNIRESEQIELDKLDYSQCYNVSTTSTGGCGNIVNHPNKLEIYKKIGLAHRGKSPTNNIPVSIEGVQYNSYYHAHRTLNLPVVTIRYRCLSTNIKFKDWYLLDSPKDIQALYRLGDNRGHKIICEGIEFVSYCEAARFYGICDTSIKYRVKSKNYPEFYLKETTLTTIEKADNCTE